MSNIYTSFHSPEENPLYNQQDSLNTIKSSSESKITNFGASFKKLADHLGLGKLFSRSNGQKPDVEEKRHTAAPLDLTKNGSIASSSRKASYVFDLSNYGRLPEKNSNIYGRVPGFAPKQEEIKDSSNSIYGRLPEKNSNIYGRVPGFAPKQEELKDSSNSVYGKLPEKNSNIYGRVPSFSSPHAKIPDQLKDQSNSIYGRMPTKEELAEPAAPIYSKMSDFIQRAAPASTQPKDSTKALNHSQKIVQELKSTEETFRGQILFLKDFWGGYSLQHPKDRMADHINNQVIKLESAEKSVFFKLKKIDEEFQKDPNYNLDSNLTELYSSKEFKNYVTSCSEFVSSYGEFLASGGSMQNVIKKYLEKNPQFELSKLDGAMITPAQRFPRLELFATELNKNKLEGMLNALGPSKEIINKKGAESQYKVRGYLTAWSHGKNETEKNKAKESIANELTQFSLKEDKVLTELDKSHIIKSKVVLPMMQKVFNQLWDDVGKLDTQLKDPSLSSEQKQEIEKKLTLKKTQLQTVNDNINFITDFKNSRR